MWRIGEFIKAYLKRCDFVVKEPRFKCRIIIDSIVATAYTVTSIVLIVIQEADIIVLWLNALCLFRAAISSTICASEVTNRINGVDIEQKCKKNNHYHLKGAILVSGFMYTICVLAAMMFNAETELMANSIISRIVKLFACIAIMLVLYNDLENNIVCMYNAEIV